jgi:negative regulator of replication initiation
MPRGTTIRSIRVSNEVWDAAKAATELEGETISDVVRRALIEYAEARVTAPPAEPAASRDA